MPEEIVLAQAVADLKTQAKPNYYATANRYDLDKDTLKNRFDGKTASRSANHLDTQRVLTSNEEKMLVDRIDYLSDRGMPPDPQYVVNLVEETVGK